MPSIMKITKDCIWKIIFYFESIFIHHDSIIRAMIDIDFFTPSCYSTIYFLQIKSKVSHNLIWSITHCCCNQKEFFDDNFLS